MHNFEETRRGDYKEPFSQTQYGAFVTKADGSVSFVAASLSEEDARLKVDGYYRSMAEHAHNNMDMTDLDRIEIRTRRVTYDVWGTTGDDE